MKSIFFLTTRNFSSNVGSFQKRSFSSSSQGVKRILEGKRAIVTGSTSGIGLGIAESLAKAGCSVMTNGMLPTANDQMDFEVACEELTRKYSVKIGYHPANMMSPTEIKDLIAKTNEKFGGVDILVNNAGIQFVSPTESFPDEQWERIISINLNAVFHATKAALPLMKKQKWGRIINVSSVHGLVASANKSAYVAAKHGVVGFTKSVALETAGTGITANCINPGWVLTPLVQKQIEAKAAAKSITVEEATIELLSEKQPSKQFVEVHHLGEVAVFLSTESASQLTGVSIPVDGGWTSQ